MRKCLHIHLDNARKNAEAGADDHPAIGVWFPMTVEQDGGGGQRAVFAHEVECQDTWTHWNVEGSYPETCCDGPIVIDGVRLEADQGLVEVDGKWVLPESGNG